MSGWPLTARGTAALALALACVIASAQLGSVQLLAFGVFLVALVAVSLAALHLARRDVTVARTCVPDAVAAGDALRVTVQVAMRTALPTTPGTWEDMVPEGLEGRSDGRFPAFGSGLRGGERSVDLVYDLQAGRRGVRRLGPLRVTVRDPFGIARRAAELGDTTRVVVTPACVPLPPLTASAGAAGGMLHATLTRMGQGADDLIARPYQAGDSMRRIHWRATAHLDALMVRQEEAESTPEATVVLDTAVTRWARDAADRPGVDPAFEAAVTACLSAVTALARDGYTVLVTDAEATALCDPVPGGDHAAIRALATRLATTTTRGHADVGTLARMPGGGSTGPLVLVTGALTTADTEALAGLPARSAHPVLLAASAAEGALEQARATGWHAASIAPGTDLSDAWAEVSHADAPVVGADHGPL